MRTEKASQVRPSERFEPLSAELSAAPVTEAVNGRETAARVQEAAAPLPHPVHMKRASRWYAAAVRNPVSLHKKNFVYARFGTGEHGELYEPMFITRRMHKRIERIPGTNPLERPMRPENVLQRRIPAAGDYRIWQHVARWLARLPGTQASHVSTGSSQAELQRARFYYALQRQLRQDAKFAKKYVRHSPMKHAA
jgi:hypothetical protein